MTEKFMHRILRFRNQLSFSPLLARYWTSRPFFNQPVELWGLPFRNPLGIAGMDPEGRYAEALSDCGFGFVVSGPFFPETGNEHILKAVRGLQHKGSVPVAAALSKRPGDVDDNLVLNDYLVPFSLLYDFVDFFIVEMEAPQIDAISEILDELVSLRLCYEHFRPILLRIPAKTPPDELEGILSFCMLSGIDGIAAEGASLVRQVVGHVSGRLPVAGVAQAMTPERALELREAGAVLFITDGGFARQGWKAPARIMKTLKNTPPQQ